MSEFDFIDRFFRPLATHPLAFGLRDDAAFIAEKSGYNLCVTTDHLIAGLHFFADDLPDLIARKVLRVNLSDLAAMGAEPFGYTLALALPKQDKLESWLESFAAGLAADQQEFDIHLLGGDTTATPGPLSITITAFGHVPMGKALHRSQAKAGDKIAVTGTLGDAAAGLIVRQNQFKNYPHLLNRYLLPQPRCLFATVLAQSGLAHAAMDISDGLWGDLSHILQASHCGAEVRLSAIPTSVELDDFIATGQASKLDLLGGGDDYELLFTFDEKNWAGIQDLAKKNNLKVHIIGDITASKDLKILDENHQPVQPSKKSYDHV